MINQQTRLQFPAGQALIFSFASANASVFAHGLKIMFWRMENVQIEGESEWVFLSNAWEQRQKNKKGLIKKI